ncbi:MAG: hypothetical protein QNJ00_01085 [Woeseiaceae bacterium]|nr:hypothetical protein [Woeseiaceae bacterium]
MKHITWLLAALLCSGPPAFAEEPEAGESEDAEATTEADTGTGDGTDAEAPPADPGGPKTLSGMSILGNEEAPKSLVIIPWKSSEIGSDLGLDDSLDERPEPVDREVFLRELEFYEIRAGK